MVKTLIDPTKLDFSEIKSALKDYLSTKPVYQDFDFSGSNLSILFDALSYNTHIMALNAYINFNETNLESAQLRGNVVTQGTALGYKPRSRIASKATVNIVVNNPIGSNNTLLLPKGTRLSSTLNNTEYPFVVMENYSVNKSIDGKFRFNNINIVQGVLKSSFFVYDHRDQYPTFVIPEQNIDTNTLVVNVKEHDSALDYITYSRYTTFSKIGIDSQIYYIDENYDGLFYLTFGDNIIGRSLENNNIIETTYVATKGIEGNGAKIFTMSETISGNNDITVTTVSNSMGGLNKEDIETVRYNATRYFASQDRCVTESDFLAIISNSFNNIETVTVYGGENLPIPEYGNIYISIKPFDRDALTLAEKDEVVNKILRPKQVGTITPRMIDPDYTNISIKVNYKYNPNKTSLSILDLNNNISSAIINYNNTVLQKFSGVFRYSNLSTIIDNTNQAITSNVISASMYKEIIPKNNDNNYFELSYTNSSFNTNGNDFTVASSPILINGMTYFLGDVPTDEVDKRQLFIYRKVDDNIQTLLSNVGYLIQSRGFMVLKNFKPDTTDPIKIYIKPNSLDLSPKYNQILRILTDAISVQGDVDAIEVGGGLGAVNYSASPISSF